MFTNPPFSCQPPPPPPLILSCTLVFIRILLAQVYKHRFFSASTSLLSSCLAQWYMFSFSQTKFTKYLFLTTDLQSSCLVQWYMFKSLQLKLTTEFLSQPHAYYHLSLHSSIGSNPLRQSCRCHCAYTVLILVQRLGYEMANFLFFRLNFGHD